MQCRKQDWKAVDYQIWLNLLCSVLSWPHFLHAEEKYQKAVEGLNPDPNSHGFWFDIQQVTGTTLSAKVIFTFQVLLVFFSMFQRAGEDPDQHEREEDGDVWRVELDQGHPHPHSLVWRRHWWTRWSPVTQSLNALQTLVVLCLFSVWIWLSCTRQYSWSGECE